MYILTCQLHYLSHTVSLHFRTDKTKVMHFFLPRSEYIETLTKLLAFLSNIYICINTDKQASCFTYKLRKLKSHSIYTFRIFH